MQIPELPSLQILTKVVAATAIALSLAIASPISAQAEEWIEVDGVHLTWDSSRFFTPDSCERYDFSWVNNSGERLLQIETRITTIQGAQVGVKGTVGVDPGISGINTVQLCSSAGVTPGTYKIILVVSHYGGATNQYTSDIDIHARPAPAPISPPQAELPAPAQPQEVTAPSTPSVAPAAPLATTAAEPAADRGMPASAPADFTPFWTVIGAAVAICMIIIVWRLTAAATERARIDRLGR